MQLAVWQAWLLGSTRPPAGACRVARPPCRDPAYADGGGWSLSSEVQTLLSASVWPGMSQWLGLTASGAASWVQPLSAQMGKLRPRVFRRLRASVSFPGWGCDGCTFPWSHSVWGLGGGKHALGASPVLQASALISGEDRLAPPRMERSAMPGLGPPCLPFPAPGLPHLSACLPRPPLPPARGGGAL